jgi:hypothetical protein
MFPFFGATLFLSSYVNLCPFIVHMIGVKLYSVHIGERNLDMYVVMCIILVFSRSFVFHGNQIVHYLIFPCIRFSW